MDRRKEQKSYVKNAKKRSNKRKGKTKIFETRPKGRFISFLSQFGGILLVGFAGMGFAVSLAKSIWYGYGLDQDAAIFFVVMIAGIGFYWSGRKNRKFLGRFRFYQRFLEGREYINLEELSHLTGRKVDFLRQDLKKMIDQKLFRQGRLDKQETCLILTDEAYVQYCEMEVARQEREKRAEESEKNQKGFEEAGSVFKEKKKNMFQKAEGIFQSADKKWQKLKDAMPDISLKKEGNQETKETTVKEDNLHQETTGKEETNFKELASDYLYFYEDRMKKIQSKSVQKIIADFGVYTVRILAHDIENESRERFFTYYLPITREMILSYEDLEREGVADKAGDLEDILNTIRYSFEIFAEKLSEGKTMDVETDILALDTMLSRH